MDVKFIVFNMAHEEGHLKEELLANISELFLTYGLRSTSMDDICNHLKMSKKTLYQLFINKDDVVEQVMLYRMRKRLGEISREQLSETNPVLFLYDIKGHIINDLGSRLPANYFDIKKYHPEVYKKICDREYELRRELLTTALSNGVACGYFRTGIDMDVQMYLFGRQMDFLCDPEMMGMVEYPVPLMISTIVDNFILAISTAKGAAEFEKINVHWSSGLIRK